LLEKTIELPPYTQIGAETLGCYIDGVPFVVTGKRILGLLNTDRGISIDINSDLITLDSRSDDFLLGLKFQTNGLPGLYYIDSPYNKFAIVGNKTSSNSYRTDYQNTGVVYLKSYDSAVISGTFSFDAKGFDGSIIHVTEGRFDVRVK